MRRYKGPRRKFWKGGSLWFLQTGPTFCLPRLVLWYYERTRWELGGRMHVHFNRT